MSEEQCEVLTAYLEGSFEIMVMLGGKYGRVSSACKHRATQLVLMKEAGAAASTIAAENVEDVSDEWCLVVDHEKSYPRDTPRLDDNDTCGAIQQFLDTAEIAMGAQKPKRPCSLSLQMYHWWWCARWKSVDQMWELDSTCVPEGERPATGVRRHGRNACAGHARESDQAKMDRAERVDSHVEGSLSGKKVFPFDVPLSRKLLPDARGSIGGPMERGSKSA